MKKIMLIVLILFVLPSVYSVGIGTQGAFNKFVEFESKPGGQIVQFQYVLKSNRAGAFGYKFSKEGYLSEYVQFIPEKFDRIDSKGGVIITPFVVRLNLPEKIEKPGLHRITLYATEVGAGGAGVSALTKVGIWIDVRVLFPGYKIEANLVAPNINEYETANMKLYIDNWGTEPVNSVKAKIDVFDAYNELVGTVWTNEDNIPVREKTTLDAYFDSTGLPPGDYLAKAEVYWDAGVENVSDNFIIGTMIVDVINYSDTLFIDTINPFKINISSRWNNPLENVYAVVKIEGKEFKTPSITLDSLGDAQLEAFIDTSGMEKGLKDIEIILYYSGSNTIDDGKVNIIDKPREDMPGIAMNSLTISLILVVLLLILLNILIILYIKRKKKKEEEFNF